MSVHPAPVAMEEHVWMKRMDFTVSVLRDLSPLTVTPRWMSVAAAHVSMAHAGMTLMGMNCYSLSSKWLFLCQSETWHDHLVVSTCASIHYHWLYICIPSYRCDCEPGWVGKNCDLDRNDCLPSPCQNAGTCIDQLNGFTCKCRQGFRGKGLA